MKNFEYVIKDELGIHARPAGLLTKEGKKFNSKITMASGEKSTDVTKLMALMAMGVRMGDTVSISIEGDDEEQAFEAMKTFFETNL